MQPLEEILLFFSLYAIRYRFKDSITFSLTMLKQSFRCCFCCIRTFIHKMVEPPEDVRIVFEKYSKDGTMSADGLCKFLSEVQGESNAIEDLAQDIFNSLKHHNIFQRKGLSFEAFFRYLLSDLNAPLSSSRSVQHDMTASLAHYFMYTGHNSYLTGNQLSSESSIEPIKKALQKSVRVIELDLWPNSKNDGVVVRHGGTLTSSVDLIKCLHAIKDHAFQDSEYPVVITFEDHLPPNLQVEVAKLVAKTFGDTLYRPNLDQSSNFPSPDSLKKKVLISTKPPDEYHETSSSKEKETPHEKKRSSKKEFKDDEMTSEHLDDAKTDTKSELETDDKDAVAEGEHRPDDEEEKTLPGYRDLIAIRAVKLKGASKNWLTANDKKVRRLSMSETKLENASIRHGRDIVRFTQNNLLRVYPKGTRIDSSNYNPFLAWMHGAQMVAFNMQGYGKYLWFMQGMFRANGGCGYVKKPNFLLSNEDFDPHKEQRVKKILKVKIYSGEGWHLDFRHKPFDPYSPPDFFVKVGIAGVEADKAKFLTKVINNNWLPEWNEEFEFELTVPELALLRIEVLEHDISGNHDFGGQTCLPISELRTGIRAVPLHNRKGDKYPSTRLLMKLNFSHLNEYESEGQTSSS